MIGFKIKFYWYEVGSSSFLFSFFSTIAYRLENKQWGSRFPVIMKEFYSGSLDYGLMPEALSELNNVKKGLANLTPEMIIWNFEDLNQQPPWGNNISKDITNLSNYFITSEGENFIKILETAMHKSMEENDTLYITSM